MKRLQSQKFIKLARAIPEDARVPYAFEKRIMAHLRSASEIDIWKTWNSLLWRAVVPCLALTLFTGLLSTFTEDPVADELFAAELETAVIAPIAQEEEAW